ncbi:hypothetical protein [Streptomyces mirabilis]|uniref:hypothetical protein n=1 Tax=Streptomyces mirabilis TaxID=68239 RepID=UPI0036DD6323
MGDARRHRPRITHRVLVAGTLSPRTVSSHLYRAFPKLGIAVRRQLRDVLEAHTADRGSA